jgi:hypothetical protein
MKTCKACDERISHGKYCTDCMAEVEREKERAREQKDRKTRKRD